MNVYNAQNCTFVETQHVEKMEVQTMHVQSQTVKDNAEEDADISSNIPVSSVFTPEEWYKKWHSKIALNVAKENIGTIIERKRAMYQQEKAMHANPKERWHTKFIYKQFFETACIFKDKYQFSYPAFRDFMGTDELSETEFYAARKK